VTRLAEFDRIADGFLASKVLKEAMDDKELTLSPSNIGSSLDLKYSSTSTDDLEKTLRAMQACINQLGG
jgi:hypothetical protein